MVKIYGVSKFLEKGINPDNYIEVECQCGYLLGYANKDDLKITGEPMFSCPSCRAKFDIVLMSERGLE